VAGELSLSSGHGAIAGHQRADADADRNYADQPGPDLAALDAFDVDDAAGSEQERDSEPGVASISLSEVGVD
jgi:hypothetical protein